ncbi:MAG TPA: tRNA lysidine(34) synthetase TilS, partial [Micavibrio sp.]|jgi:tRNA(Ile)-lysidine synthase
MGLRAAMLEQAICRRFNDSSPVQALLENPPDSIAVAVSGGPDSMALLYLLSGLSHIRGKAIKIHALTVDHALRPESAKEASKVGKWIAGWSNVTHHTLKWRGQKPDKAIMEKARDMRYGLLQKWCQEHDIDQLWVAHHETDQIETFLFRLAKGSGLDGLAGMEFISLYRKTGLALMRPLLECSKAMIEEFCAVRNIPFVKDPTNKDLAYARTRLRQSLPVLEAEGLSEKRIAATARRMGRARDALDFYAGKLLRKAVKFKKGTASIDMTALGDAPLDIRIRLVRKILAELGEDGYGPRLAPLEDRLEVLFGDFEKAKKFTLGNYLFSPDRKKALLTIAQEKS